MIEERLAGLSISQIPEADLVSELNDALVSVSVISGHRLPEDIFFADRLTRQMALHFQNFGYGDLTLGEIVLAFNLNCKCGLKYPSGIDVSTTDIFGSFISVDYVSRVLNTYLSLRNLLDNQLKNIIDGY